MNESVVALKRMAVYYLLLLINILFCANLIIKDSFPLRNISTIYLLVISSLLVLYYNNRVSPTCGLSSKMKMISLMGLLLILLRGIKYSAFSGVGVLARHTWYFYYVPILLLPLSLFYISLFVFAKNKEKNLKIWKAFSVLTIILIILVLTNDIHQQVFIFNDNFEDWDSNYVHGWLFYIVYLWQFTLYFSAIIILILKCRISSSKKDSWVLMIPFLTGVIMYALLLTGKMPKINSVPIIEFPESIIFTATVVLECCMQLGLIPTNTDYKNLFKNLPLSAQITNTKYLTIYSSPTAVTLSQKQLSTKSGNRIGEHTVLNKMEIPGGYGFWQDDMTEIDRLNTELNESKENLSQQAELTRLNNELKEKQTKIKERTFVYDMIAKSTHRQSQQISQFSKMALETTDSQKKDYYRHRIVLLASYIKRYANLMVLSKQNDKIEVGELGLAFTEVLRYLNFCGIPSEHIGSGNCTINSVDALTVFEIFESIINTYYSVLKGIFVNLSVKENIELKMIIENINYTLNDVDKQKLQKQNIGFEIKNEDDITYFNLTIKRGK